MANKKYELSYEILWSEYDRAEHSVKQVEFETTQELQLFLEDEMWWYLEHGVEYIVIDVFESGTWKYITTIS